jgi:hypothetical protein
MEEIESKELEINLSEPEAIRRRAVNSDTEKARISGFYLRK